MTTSHLQLPPLVWGAWRLMKSGLDAQQLNRLIHHCVELGISAFDHADIYGGYQAELLFGQALALSPGLRQQVQLLTKCGITAIAPARPQHTVKTYNSSAAHIRESVQASLVALRCERLELLMIHRPDWLMDAQETAAALDALVAEGWVAHIGVSNFSASQISLLASRLKSPISVNQIELSLGQMQAIHNGLLDHCQQQAIRPMAWSPLAGGALFGDTPLAQRLAPELRRLAGQHACSETAIALAWLLRLPAGVVPVIGSCKPVRITEAAQALRIELSRADWYRLWSAAADQAVP